MLRRYCIFHKTAPWWRDLCSTWMVQSLDLISICSGLSKHVLYPWCRPWHLDKREVLWNLSCSSLRRSQSQRPCHGNTCHHEMQQYCVCVYIYFIHIHTRIYIHTCINSRFLYFEAILRATSACPEKNLSACFGLLPNTLQWREGCNGKILLSRSSKAAAPRTPGRDAEVSEASNRVNFVVLQPRASRDTAHATTSVARALPLPIPGPRMWVGRRQREELHKQSTARSGSTSPCERVKPVADVCLGMNDCELLAG